MMDEEIVLDENFTNEQEGQEEDLFSGEETSSNTQQIVFNPENINFSEPFFMGVTICGVMCMLSLGVYIVTKILRNV